MSLKDLLNTKIKIYRGLAIACEDEDCIPELKNEIGVSWTIFEPYASFRAEEMKLFHKTKYPKESREIVVEADLNIEDIDWGWSLGAYYDQGHWSEEYEVVLLPNIPITFKIIYDSYWIDKDKIIRGNTGEGNYDETMFYIEEDDDDYHELKRNFIKDII